MATVIDLDDVRPYSQDLDELRFLLRRLVGKPFLFFRASYDEELTLHLGSPIPYQNPKLKPLRKGTFLLGSRTSAWMLEPGLPPSRILASEGAEIIRPSGRARRMELDEIETEPTIRPGSLVTDATASPSPMGLILSLSFSDGSTLVLIPTPQEADDGDREDEEPLADWEIFMPGHRLLRAGPGESWSYIDSRTKSSLQP